MEDEVGATVFVVQGKEHFEALSGLPPPVLPAVCNSWSISGGSPVRSWIP